VKEISLLANGNRGLMIGRLGSFDLHKAGERFEEFMVAILSRQFVEMTRSRIEGLLNSFPKLIAVGDQHTFVVTDQVRYVYQAFDFNQPLDQLFIVLITNKNSNILQDIDTLQLYSRVVSEYCRSTDEREITANRFELILVFDEILSMGYRENVNLGQIKTISLMESNDERIEAEIQKNKEREAKEESKRRAQMMEMKAREARQQQRSSFGSSGGYGSGTGYGGGSGYGSSNQYGAGSTSSSGTYGGNSFGSNYGSNTPSYAKEEPQPTYSNPPPGKGMQLGRKSTQSSLFENIKQAEGVREFTEPPPRVETRAQPESPLEEQLTQEGIHFLVEEKISVTANRDGGLENMVVNGTMTLKVNDPSQTKLQVQVGYQNDPSLQFKTHPYVDKALWSSQNRVGFAKPLPVGQPIGVLKWKFNGKDESQIPLLVTCWPSPTGNGCDVTIEYELQTDLQLHDVSIAIPFV
jgi:hypothetical protein